MKIFLQLNFNKQFMTAKRLELIFTGNNLHQVFFDRTASKSPCGRARVVHLLRYQELAVA
jgi:hypothetical protein